MVTVTVVVAVGVTVTVAVVVGVVVGVGVGVGVTVAVGVTVVVVVGVAVGVGVAAMVAVGVAAMFAAMVAVGAGVGDMSAPVRLCHHPILSCKRCLADGASIKGFPPGWQTHYLVNERTPATKAPDLDGSKGHYVQDYCCQRCGYERRWGYTGVRITDLPKP